MPLEYLSDVSDNDEPSQSEDESGRGRKSSAFQMELLCKDKDEPPPKFDPLPITVITRNLSIPCEPRAPTTDSSETSPDIKGDIDLLPGVPFFDPFTTVIDKDSPSSPKIIGISQDLIESITKAGASRAAGLAGESGNEPDDEDEDDSPESRGTIENRYSEGIVNHGFTDNKSSIESPSGGNEVIERTERASSEEHAVSPVKEDTTTEPPATITASETGALAEPVSGTGPITQDNTLDVFGGSDSGLAASSGFDNDPTDSGRDPFETSEFLVEPVQDSLPYTDSAAFDAFAAKFDSTSNTLGTSQNEQNPDSMSSSFDPFSSPANKGNNSNNISSNKFDDIDGFDIFDSFASGSIKPPKNTPAKQNTGQLSAAKAASKDSFDDDDEDDSFRVVIKSQVKDNESNKESKSAGPLPLLPPPPKTPIKSIAYQDKEPVQGAREAKKANEFDEFEMFFGNYISKDSNAKSKDEDATGDWPPPALGEAGAKARTESMESPSTPLFDDDTSQPLEDFPPRYDGNGWEMYLRHPAKKKLTGNRYWKKVFVRLSENSVIQLFNKPGDNEPFQELPLQPCYSLSEVTSQQYDQYGKIFTVKVQYIFYRERVGVRKGQIAKVMQGQITSVSGLAKLGMPLEHSPQVSQLIKLGSLVYDDVKVFANLIEDAFFRMVIHRDRALTYKTEEIQVTVVDEYYVETTKTGLVTKQLARVRVFMLAFINGMPTIEIGVNDMIRQGKEIVGRHDIIPVVTEEWIRLEAIEFHSSVMKEEYEKEDRLIKVHPPDACFFELLRFRVRPPKHRELPLQVTANLTVTKAKVELRCEVLVPGCISRKYGQIPCEDIAIRMHIPECWIYFFRTEKHLRYGSVKSAARRPGKIKGIERFLGATSNLESTMLEASAGVAKYEHAFHSLVWRIPRLPKEGQGAYTQQLMVCRLPMSSFDQIPDKFYEFVHIEFTMPSTTVSHAVIRSISVTNDNPPEKYVRYVSKHEYRTELIINFKEKDDETDYQIAASVPLKSQPVVLESDKENKDGDSDDSYKADHHLYHHLISHPMYAAINKAPKDQLCASSRSRSFDLLVIQTSINI
uniref:MHD domain-containing protein n=1 Tax=Tetranychus urticae TaxID=32264 RepID=T1KGR5_TETUR